MSNLNKTVLIITLGKVYSAETNNGSQIKEYRKQINNEKKQIGADHLVRFLSAKDMVEKEDKNNLDDFFSKYSIDIPMEIEDNYDKLELGISKMLDNNSKAKTDLDKKVEDSFKDMNCYREFERVVKIDETTETKYKVVLLLWDVLGRDRGEQIVPFGLFIEQVCKDLGITDKKDSSGYTNNMLYVHDQQLIGKNDDVTIFDRSDPSFKGEYDHANYFDILNKYFDYVAVFGHSATFGGIFYNNILQFRFGPVTTADKIAKEEAKATSFQSLREIAQGMIS